MSSIAKQLAEKIAAEGLNQTQAANAIGVSLPSFRGVISGKSTPNKRSADRYAAFLGIAVEDVLGAKSTKNEAPAKRRGRKPGRKPGRPAAAAAAKPGRKPGRKSKSSEGSISEALKAIAVAVEAAEVLLADDLAVAVHGLDKRTREKIAFLIG